MKQNYLHEILELEDAQKDELAAAFEKVLSINGWVNVEPVVEDDSRGETPGLFSWFSAIFLLQVLLPTFLFRMTQ